MTALQTTLAATLELPIYRFIFQDKALANNLAIYLSSSQWKHERAVTTRQTRQIIGLFAHGLNFFLILRGCRAGNYASFTIAYHATLPFSMILSGFDGFRRCQTKVLFDEVRALAFFYQCGPVTEFPNPDCSSRFSNKQVNVMASL